LREGENTIGANRRLYVIKRIDHQWTALRCSSLRPRAAARMSALLACRRLQQLLPAKTGFMRWVLFGPFCVREDVGYSRIAEDYRPTLCITPRKAEAGKDPMPSGLKLRGQCLFGRHRRPRCKMAGLIIFRWGQEQHSSCCRTMT